MVAAGRHHLLRHLLRRLLRRLLDRTALAAVTPCHVIVARVC
jgi:hypothetical protein